MGVDETENNRADEAARKVAEGLSRLQSNKHVEAETQHGKPAGADGGDDGQMDGESV